MALKFLDSVGLAHVFDKIKALLAEKSDTSHTHNYAGSASVGGAANSANKLNTNAGSTSTPVYFENGVPKACTSLQLEVSGNAESATKDADGNVITATYATKTEVTSATSTAKSYTDTAIANLIGSADSTMDTLGEIQTAMKDNADVVEALNSAIGSKAPSDHTHNYAGSSSAGGAATSANKLNTNAGGTTQPVYFANGVPVKTTYTLGASVPSDAKFTDTIYELPDATASVKGGVKVGSNLTVSSGTLSLTKANVTAALGYTPSGSDTTYSEMTGATSSAAGTSGLVPAPASGKQSAFLRGDGTWATPTDTKYTAMTASEATTGTATTARSITAKVLHDKINEVVEANAYSLPTASSTLGGVKTTSTVTSTSGLTACPIIGGVPYYKDTDTTATLSSLGITATAEELNYVDGVTSNIQTQLNGKLSTSGTAAKATADASGNNIVNTYATKTELATALTTDEIDAILV